MSWGVDITVDHQDGYTTTVEVVSGHTYNLTPMWRKALPSLLINGTTRDLHGLKCSDIAAALSLGLLDAERNRATYEDLNPPNGWGDYEGFAEILGRLAHLAHQHPRGVLRWNG